MTVVKVPSRTKTISGLGVDGASKDAIKTTIRDALREVDLEFQHLYDFGKRKWKSGEVTVTLEEAVEKIYKDIPRDVLDSYSLRFYSDSEEMSPAISIPVHPECALLAYHLEHPAHHPCECIGTSKRICFACRIYFTAYKTVAEGLGLPSFELTAKNDLEEHHQVELPWAYPVVCPSDIIGSNIAENLEKEMIRSMRVQMQDYVKEYVRKSVVVDDEL